MLESTTDRADRPVRAGSPHPASAWPASASIIEVGIVGSGLPAHYQTFMGTMGKQTNALFANFNGVNSGVLAIETPRSAIVVNGVDLSKPAKCSPDVPLAPF